MSMRLSLRIFSNVHLLMPLTMLLEPIDDVQHPNFILCRSRAASHPIGDVIHGAFFYETFVSLALINMLITSQAISSYQFCFLSGDVAIRKLNGFAIGL